MQYSEEMVNKIIIRGRIVAESYRQDGSCMVTLISRSGRDVFARVICAPGMLPEHKDHARLYIKGHFELKAETPFNSRKKRIIQQIVADEVVIDSTMAEDVFGIKGKFFYPFECAAHLKGIIKSVKDEGEWVRYSLEVCKQGKAQTPIILRTSIKKLDRHPDIKKDDKVCMICGISTPKKTHNEKNIHYEDIIIVDIAKY